MKVKELISILESMPQDADVMIIYDGEPRSGAEVLYEANDGRIMITDFGEFVYSEESFPKGVFRKDVGHTFTTNV